MPKDWLKPLSLTLCLILMLAAPLVMEARFAMDILSQMAVYAVFAVSLNILLGYTGNLSFGHAAYFALGGYACAWLLSTAEWYWWLAMPAAVVFAALVAAIIGWFCVRLQDIYFAILTLAFSMLIWSILYKWVAVTGGDDGFIGVVLPDFLTDPVGRYLFIIGVALISLVFVAVVLVSPFGLAIQAIRDNSLRVAYLGYPVASLRLVAFTLAGAVAGLAGVLLCVHQRAMFPESAFWLQSGQVLIMVLLGGMHHFIGPIIGAVIFIGLEVTLGQWTGYWQAVLGCILLFVVLCAPRGVVGLWFSAMFWRKHKA